MTQTRSHVKKTYNFDLEVKGQGLLEVINVPDTLSHGNIAMCQIWYACVEKRGSCGTDTNPFEKTL